MILCNCRMRLTSAGMNSVHARTGPQTQRVHTRGSTSRSKRSRAQHQAVRRLARQDRQRSKQWRAPHSRKAAPVIKGRCRQHHSCTPLLGRLGNAALATKTTRQAARLPAGMQIQTQFLTGTEQTWADVLATWIYHYRASKRNEAIGRRMRNIYSLAHADRSAIV